MSLKKNLNQKFIVSFIVSSIIFSLLFFSTLNNYFFNMSYDTFNNLKVVAEKSPGVVIIGIDDASLAKYDKNNTGVIPRDVYSEFLNILKKYKPSVVAFDILFDIKSNEEHHKKFLDAIKSYGDKIVLSSYFQRNYESFEENYITPYSQHGLNNISWGYVNVFKGVTQDEDSVRRRFKPFECSGDKIVYSLPASVMNTFYGVEISRNFNLLNFFDRESKELKFSAPVVNGSSFISYTGNAESFHLITLEEFLCAEGIQSEIHGKLIDGSIVIVGSVSPRHRDIQNIPALSFNAFAKNRPEYGVVILANIIKSYLDNNFLNIISANAEYSILLIFNIGAGTLLSLTSPMLGLVLLLVLILGFLFSGFVLFSKGYIINCIILIISTIITYFILTLYQFNLSRKETYRMASTLKKYVSPEIAKLITREEFDNSEQGAKKIITVLFSDIRGFTPMSEKMDPKEISHLLNEYFNEMTRVIFKNKGTIDKFIGDAIMVLFGAPVELEDAPLRAIKTAIEMRSELEKLKNKWKEDGSASIDVGIGINTGEAFVGTLGSDIHKEYTALGDTVNTAARFESKAQKGQILISESTLRAVRKHIKFNELEPIMLKGKSKPHEVFEVISLINDENREARSEENPVKTQDDSKTPGTEKDASLAGDTIEENLNARLLKAVLAVNLDEINRLIKAGADVNFKDPNGVALIIFATGRNELEIVKLLIENNADINARSNKGITALILAAGKGNEKIVDALISGGANVNITVGNEMSALKLAMEKGYDNITAMLKKAGATE